ncbi:RDD family protein [uncultured Jatrophihabitans sp.]|uniref:RDD family protein n=1 Tax=uncultured Jatrophihabitans sp. TaxID=1610747 RepID=UPI0035CC04D4
MQPTGAPIVSGEGVRLVLPRAGVGSRTVAAALDAAIELAALSLLLVVDVQLALGSDAAAVVAIVIVEVALLLAGYPILTEWLTHGRTVGKLVFGLRVVRDDGGPIGFRQALVRGLAGLVLEKPGLLYPLTTIAGVWTMSLSSEEKRLGDMMAGTVVLNERAGPAPVVPLPTWVPVPLQPWVLSLDLHRLDDRLALSLRQFVTRAHAMSDAGRYALGEQLRERVLAVVSPPPPQYAPTPQVLVSVLVERRRRAYEAAQRQHRAAPTYVTPNGPPPGGDGPFRVPG